MFLRRYSHSISGSEDPLLSITTDDNDVIYITAVNRHHELFRCTGGTDEDHPNDRVLIAIACLRNLASRNVLGGTTYQFFNRICERGYRVPDVEDFKNHRKLDSGGIISATSVEGETFSNHGVGKERPFKQRGIKVLDLYKPPRPFRDMLGDSISGEYGECLTATEVSSNLL